MSFLQNSTRMTVLAILVACSGGDKPPAKSPAPASDDAKNYRSSVLYVSKLGVQDLSTAGNRLRGIKERTRASFLNSAKGLRVVLKNDSNATMGLDVENQCTPSRCFLVLVVHYAFPDPEGFNYRYREQGIKTIEGTRYEEAVEGLREEILLGLHFWRSGMDLGSPELKSWINYGDRTRLKEGLRVVRDRGLTGLASTVFEVFADPAGSYNMDAVWTASALITKEHIPQLVTLASSSNTDIAIPALKSLGMSGLANRDILNRIQQRTTLDSVNAEAKFWLEKIPGSSDSESSDTRN